VQSLSLPSERAAYPAELLKVEVEVNLRPTVSRSVCLGVKRPSGTFDHFFFLIEIPFRHMRVCYFVAPSLTRGRVCNLLYNCNCRTHDYILLSHLRLPQPGGPGPCIYIPQEQIGPVIPSGTGFPLVASYYSQGSGGGILTRLHTGKREIFLLYHI
jgi:hypothetical protein